MTEAQVYAEIGRMHMENLLLRAQVDELQAVVREMARNPAVEPTDTMTTGNEEAPGDPEE